MFMTGRDDVKFAINFQGDVPPRRLSDKLVEALFPSGIARGLVLDRYPSTLLSFVHGQIGQRRIAQHSECRLASGSVRRLQPARGFQGQAERATWSVQPKRWQRDDEDVPVGGLEDFHFYV